MSDDVLPLVTDRGDIYANELQVVLVERESGKMVGVRVPERVLVPVHESAVPEELRIE